MSAKKTYKVTKRGDGKKIYGKIRKVGEPLSLTVSEALFERDRGMIELDAPVVKKPAKG